MPRIIGGSLDEHRERMQERIFTAMAQLLREHGYGAITLADVAAAADIGRTAMYNYYPDKETLLLAYAAHETERYLKELSAALADVTNPVDQLRVFVRMQLQQLTTQHIAPGSLSNVLTDAGHRQMLEHIAPLHSVLRNIIVDAVEQRYLPEDDVDLLLPLVTASIAGRSTADLRGKRLARAIDTTTTFVLRGLGAKLDADGHPRRLARAVTGRVTAGQVPAGRSRPSKADR
ncbi:TetR/AcrR family transcriptional regulator [Dactylosporangium roseum]|uniref:TetR/AcrR family transcriptional regulator n=1 Tax=Dactylosporangium roseum TaxID=47989 RepID=A0ABY5ZEL8_9ACTN|nr:TetR/AcrR family transcriptional regulator [Dactylosporangium roseum]UWZ39093.1 TetR/AcrR family transcriptional regulator [Dactylosporangium roseum]